MDLSFRETMQQNKATFVKDTVPSQDVLFVFEPCKWPLRGKRTSINWRVSHECVAYEESALFLETRAEDVARGNDSPLIWLCEHASIYTVGTSGKPPVDCYDDIPVICTNRGGKITYHGPGQRMVYIVWPIKEWGWSLTSLMSVLVEWGQGALNLLRINAFYNKEKIGLWTLTPLGPKKLVSFGLRVRKGVVFYGFCINVTVPLQPFQRIEPCGLRGSEITSLKALEYKFGIKDVDRVLEKTFHYF